MHRLFVAVRPPSPIRQRLIQAMGGITGARWQTDGQLHLTLRFIGEADRHLAHDIHAALGAIHHPRFEIAVNGLGTFERRDRPETVWAGVAPHESLKALHKKVDQALARVGIGPDTRAFHPHITLARLNRSAGPVHDFLADAAGLSTPPFTVDGFTLYESRLSLEGAVYTAVELYALG
ncbi:MAG TPA: RNA 2',3'-cyclic phosphodiesterase [Allosphingosinicella sp.]|nr:RNA 2',3'-cyclic phosphodiesterase [Allosphingosinicella sp.]